MHSLTFLKEKSMAIIWLLFHDHCTFARWYGLWATLSAGSKHSILGWECFIGGSGKDNYPDFDYWMVNLNVTEERLMLPWKNPWWPLTKGLKITSTCKYPSPAFYKSVISRWSDASREKSGRFHYEKSTVLVWRCQWSDYKILSLHLPAKKNIDKHVAGLHWSGNEVARRNKREILYSGKYFIHRLW